MRTSVAALLAGVLISLIFAAGCAGGNEQASEETTEDQTTEQATQQASKEATKERTKARKDKARSEQAVLEMEGSEGTEFSGSCTVGDEETEISGQVPDRFTYDLDGNRLDCEIRKESADGDLKVTFTSGNAHSVQQISGGTLNLTYENGRLSSFSSSSGSSGNSASSSQQVVSSSSQNSSSSVSISP